MNREIENMVQSRYECNLYSRNRLANTLQIWEPVTQLFERAHMDLVFG